METTQSDKEYIDSLIESQQNIAAEVEFLQSETCCHSIAELTRYIQKLEREVEGLTKRLLECNE